MDAKIIDGRAHAASITDMLKQTIQDKNLNPGLAVVLVGEDPASQIYVTRKKKACEDIGINGQIHRLSANAPEQDVLTVIHQLNEDKHVHGILLQLPLPAHFDTNTIIEQIDPRKDVDGLTPYNLGRLMGGTPHLIPCTPQGVLELLKRENISLAGKHALIIGRSVLFGKPMGQLLLGEDCTVTQCHSKTENLPTITRQADIVIAATGQAKMVKGAWLKNGCTVIDVGISRGADNKISGDVDFDTAVKIASSITPVPGGVGPMTVACLLWNTVRAAQA